jgi:hypothetical protein
MSISKMIELIEGIDKYTEPEHIDVNEGNLINPEENHKELNKELYLRELLDKSINDTELINFRKSLSEMVIDMKNQRSPMSFILRKRWYLVAASVSITVVSGVLSLILLEMPVSKPEIYKDYFQTAKPFMIQRSVNQIETDYFTQAMKYYNAKNYKMSAQILLSNQINAASRFYAAISLMELGDFSKAERLLYKVANDDTNLFVDQAEWYLGLCYLVNDKSDLAIKQFEKIAATQNYYNDKAAEIIKKID